MFSTIATLLVTATLLSASSTTALPTSESPVTGGQVPEGGEGQVNGSIDGEIGIGSTQGLIPEDDTWGPWSDEWSQCSRSCGGGVSYQERKCITSRPGLRPNCVGPDRNYGSCNIQDCPEGSQDFRAEQCSKYNTEPFQGNLYTWVPYLGAENKCELNCMPKGKNFYYRISKQVIDGTPCESDKLDVCVNGECMKVGCDNMLGSDAKEDICRECNGDGSSCKVVQGVFKRRKLPFGYNDILVLPAGAMNINITEVKPSNNFLALRNANGQYYINGNFSIDFPQPFQVGGTIVYYERDLNSPSYGSEVIHALGPITEPLFVVLVTQERNYGISHSYAVPSGSEGAKPDTYRWVLEQFTECSRTCGGGYQLRKVWCARTRDYEASPDYLCDPTLKPAVNHSCNMISCPPSWFEGEWSPCSTSCGVGQQVRLVYCEQVMHGVRAEIIDDSFCQTGSLGDKPEYQQECMNAVCPVWTSGNWSQCSVTCGRGVQTRSVVCSSDEVLGDSSCPADTKPDSRVECDLGPCENVDWLVSAWTDCSQRCGEGIQTRQLYCVGPSGTIYSEDVCNANLRPDSTQQCSSMLACPPMWHASRWTECSTDCGDGVRIRNVFCAHLVDGEWMTALDSVCNATIKLPTSEVCSNGRCVESTWFTGSWGECSVHCGGGKKTRQIMCFGEGLSLDGSACDMSSQPIEQESCNTHLCNEDEGGCENTAHGCCSDQTTPATGPNQEGCNTSSTNAPTEAPTSFPTCVDTAFGCCANNIDAASGPEGQGCEEGEPLETCELAQDTGPCFAYGIKWFFDIYYQRCTQFWYGGCGGNVNRFDSELECQAVCTIQQDPMAQEEICALAMEVGPCKASINSYFYNTESGECESFNYGGCHGNRNKFRTKEECDIKCGTMNKDPCSLQRDPGNCFETQVRWFYDAYSNQCERFNYTGCLGNPNRFEDAASCEEKCLLVDRVPVIQETVGIIVDVCGLPADAGPCEDSVTHWAYNKDLNACRRFNYGGCEGNDNRFASEIECRHACVSIAAEECSMDLDSGPCFDYFPTWGFNKTVGLCQPFVYGGCEGNDNRFETENVCDHKCGPKAVTKCHRSRNYAFYISQGNLGAFIPQCTLEGYFESMQCHGSTGYCWCVDMDGKEINGSRRAPGIHVQRPDCEALRPKVLTTCQRHVKEVTGKDGVSPPGRYVPQCTDTGDYETIQCHGSTGYCWCVNENGEEVEGSRRGPGMGAPNCHAPAKGCQAIRDERLSSGLIGAFIPECSEEGLYKPTQCHGSTGYCWCVNEIGEEILETRRGPGEERIDCEALHPKVLTTCQRHVKEVTGEDGVPPPGRYVPQCTEAGEYETIQCYGSTGYCWCVNENGEEVEGSRRGPGMGAPNCHGGPQGPCPTLISNLQSGLATSGFNPQCTPDGLFVRVQCDGVAQCLCVNESTGDILKVLNEVPQDGDFDACNDAHEDLTPCQRHRNSVLSEEELDGHIRYVPECTESGDYKQTQCYGDTGHCWCVNDVGEEIDGTRKQPGQGLPDCNAPAKGCQAIRDERLSSGLIGAFIPECSEEGLYKPTQCHGSTGYCWCVNEIGEEILETRRGPGEDKIDCEDVCSFPKVTGPCRGFFPVFGYDRSTGSCDKFIYGGCQGNGNLFQTLQACLVACTDYQPATSTVSPPPVATTSTSTRSTRDDETTTDSSSATQSATQASTTSTKKPEPSTRPSTTSSTASISATSASLGESSTESATTVISTTTELSTSAQDKQREPFTTQESTTHHSSMCEIHRQEALANTLPGVFIPQCAEDGSFLPKQCYGLLSLCWCVHEDGTEQGGTRVGINEPLDCMDVCSMPEFRGQCPDNIDMWFFNAEAGVCEMFVYSGCQGNQNQFESQEACEKRCITPAPTSCVEKREMALSTGNLGEFVPQCTEDGQFTSQQCHGSIGHCWCVDDQGMELGATRRGPGEELLDCEDVCRLPKYSGPCRGNFALWYYDVMEERCKSFTYGGCQGNGNRFESLEECEQLCHTPEFTGRTPTPCEIKRDETLSTSRLHLFVPECTEDGAYTSRQCYDLIGQCWCVNEEGETQGGTKTRDGEVPFDCNDKCSFPKFTGHCKANLDRWFYNMETGSCEEFVYGGCRGNMNNFKSQEECEQSCVPNGHEMQSCKMQKELALSSNLPDAFIPQCTQDGWFAPSQCHDSTGQCWCVTESGMEQGDTRREQGMELLDCDDVCSFPKSSGPCLAYFAMWYYDREEQQCRRFIYGGCQGNGNRFETQEECEQSCTAQVSTTVEPASLCEVTRSDAQAQGLLGSFIPQCTEEGLFSRLQCHGSTGYCWCVDELTGEEIGNSAAATRGVQPDCDAYYQFDSIPDVIEENTSDPIVDFTISQSHAFGDEGCATSPFGCCPDGTTQATRDDHFGCPGVAPPMVEVAPSDSTVILGDTLTINCRSGGNPTPTTTWHRHDTNVEYLQDARISVTEDGTLNIDGVTEDDAGPYVCRASNGVGQAAKVAVDVKVFTPVEIPETSQHSLKVKEGDLVLLYCHAIGNPKPTVTWMRGDSVLPGEDPRMTQQEDDTLRIENVDLGDAGNYVCTGHNMFGTIQKRTVTLIVQAKVQIVTRPEDITAGMGETITLPCASIGSPKPTIIWRVNMIDLPSKDRFETSSNGDLTIRDLKSTDAGQYTCTAANGESVETAGATVTVTGANSDPNCQDNSVYANCRLVLKAGMCNTPPFTEYCCATCRDNNHAKRRRRRRR